MQDIPSYIKLTVWAKLETDMYVGNDNTSQLLGSHRSCSQWKQTSKISMVNRAILLNNNMMLFKILTSIFIWEYFQKYPYTWKPLKNLQTKSNFISYWLKTEECQILLQRSFRRFEKAWSENVNCSWET